MNTRSFLLSSLIAGVVIGLLGNLPILNLINCFFCVFVWAGAILAVLLYRRFQPGQLGLTPGQGAGLGALSGLVGALVGLVVNPLTSYISVPLWTSLARSFQIQGDLPFKTGDLGSLLSTAIIFFIVDAVLYPLFGAISGFIAVNLIGKQSQPAS